MRENEMKREKDMSQMRGGQVKWKWVWVNESDQELMSCQMIFLIGNGGCLAELVGKWGRKGSLGIR